MKQRELIRLFVLFDLVVIGIIICFYYWVNSTLESMKHVPIYIMILAFVYILFQIIKRYISRNQNWWDWLYYIGLVVMMLPTLFLTDQNLTLFNLLTDVGIIFLIVPVLLDGFKLLKRN